MTVKRSAFGKVSIGRLDQELVSSFIRRRPRQPSGGGVDYRQVVGGEISQIADPPVDCVAVGVRGGGVVLPRIASDRWTRRGAVDRRRVVDVDRCADDQREGVRRWTEDAVGRSDDDVVDADLRRGPGDNAGARVDPHAGRASLDRVRHPVAVGIGGPGGVAIRGAQVDSGHRDAAEDWRTVGCVRDRRHREGLFGRRRSVADADDEGVVELRRRCPGESSRARVETNTGVVGGGDKRVDEIAFGVIGVDGGHAVGP